MSMVFKIIMIIGLIGLAGNVTFCAFFTSGNLDDEETFINPVSVISSFLYAIGIVGLIAMKLYQMNLFE